MCVTGIIYKKDTSFGRWTYMSTSTYYLFFFFFRLYRNIYNKYIEPETNEGKKKKEEELYKQYKKIK